MKNKKVAVLLSAVGVVVAVAVAGTTLAYLFTKSDTANNRFAPGTVSNEIVENSKDTPESHNQLADGKKQVQIKNTGTIDVYIRVKLIPGWKYTHGEANTAALQLSAMPDTITGSIVDLGDMQLKLDNSWSDTWLYQNGYFYYKSAVPSGQNTSLLLQEVLVKSGKSSNLLNQFQLDVLSETIQVSDPVNEQPALKEAWGAFQLDSKGNIVK